MRFQRYRAADGLYYWRFPARNHRIVAISPRGFQDKETVTGAVNFVRNHVFEGIIDFSSDRGGMWVWTMRLSGTAIAVSAHPYGRRREADSAAQRFRIGAAQAGMDEWVIERGEQRPRPRHLPVFYRPGDQGGGGETHLSGSSSSGHALATG